jgi:hypothetical protein|tara:strand:- start:438 stop:620 length:183 start_codon:yes stop_codon:yes gene_type:complete
MKNNKWMIPLLGTILLGISSWVVITVVELQAIVMMLKQELLDLDKVIGRIYNHMDRLSER